MPNLFNQDMPPEIIKATDDLRQQMGPMHVAAIKAGSVWSSVHNAVNKAQSAGSIKQYMEFLLETREWEGGEELRQRLRLHLNAGRIANWQLIAREHAAGVDYYVFPTLRDLIHDKEHWGLGLTETQLQKFIEPEEPALWGLINAALIHAQAPGRDDSGRFDRHSKNAKTDEVEQNKQARTRALGRALEDTRVREMFNDEVLPKTVATSYGSVSKDADHEQLKADCLERAYAAYAEAKQAMADQSMAQQGKTIAAARKQVREALEPIKRWKPKPLGSADSPQWADNAVSLLRESYATADLDLLSVALSNALSAVEPD